MNNNVTSNVIDALRNLESKKTFDWVKLGMAFGVNETVRSGPARQQENGSCERKSE